MLEAGGRIRGGGVVLRTFEETLSAVPARMSPLSPLPSACGAPVSDGHRGAVVWLTGLPSSGKSTIGRALERRLFDGSCHVVLLDGDTCAPA